MKTQENIASEFNEFSKNYTEDMIGCVPYYLNLLSSFIDYLPKNHNPSNILDLGCGNGNVTAKLLNHFPNASYTLVDASTEMIEICKNRFKKYRINYADTYFNKFNFELNKYDLIAAGFSLHHCMGEEKKYIFNKIYEALKKGGIFSYSDLMISKNNPAHPALIKQWETFVNNNFPNTEKWNWLMEHYETFDKPDNYFDQIKWLEGVGFNNISLPFQEGYWTHLKAIK